MEKIRRDKKDKTMDKTGKTTRLTSPKNDIITLTNSLFEKKNRDRTGLFLIEGERGVSEIPDDWDLLFYILSDDFAESRNTDIYVNRAKTYTVPDSLFDKLSGSVTPQGILAVCRRKEYSLEQILAKEKNLLLLLLYQTQDPGNTGGMLRIAHACGVDGVILSKGCADVYNPKTVRASVGSVFKVPFIQNADMVDVLNTLKKSDIAVYGAHLKTEIFPYLLDFTENCAIIIGNEANGLSDEISEKCGSLVKIPLPGGAESLNASVACGMIMYEAMRQRLTAL